MYKIKFDPQTAGDGTKVTIAGVGELENGKELIVPDSVNDDFKRAHASYSFIDGKIVVKDGPSLISAFKKRKDITVSHAPDPIPTPKTENGGSND